MKITRLYYFVIMYPILCLLLTFSVKGEVSYIDAFKGDNLRNIESNKTDHFYVGTNKTKNYYSKFTYNSGLIRNPLVIITGLEDPAPFWFETALEAEKWGFREVYIVDLRGQGQSDRVLKGQQKLIYVEDFKDYISDVLLFFDSAFKDKTTERPYIISHSTGSIVITNALKEMRAVHIPLKMSFWTPLTRLKINPILENKFVYAIVRFIDQMSLSLNYPIVVKKYKKVEFQSNKLTTSSEKHKASEFMRFKGGLGSDGVTLHWVLEAIKASADFRKHLKTDMNIETLVLKAGEETVVDNSYEFSNKKIIVKNVIGAKHALNIETNEILNSVINLTFEFLLDKTKSPHGD
jgi:alpha-beta hydrolase superfamily lysophospholipase